MPHPPPPHWPTPRPNWDLQVPISNAKPLTICPVFSYVLILCIPVICIFCCLQTYYDYFGRQQRQQFMQWVHGVLMKMRLVIPVFRGQLLYEPWRSEFSTQINDWSRGPTELVQHFWLQYRGVHFGARTLFDINWYGLAISLSYPSGEEGGILQVQLISTCRRGA